MLPSILSKCDESELLAPGAGAAESRPVVVVIDGSRAAVQAAIWATREAAKRHACLRLVHIIAGHPQCRDRGYAHAGQALHKASKAVHAVDESVIVDSDVFDGDSRPQFVELSREAALICLGSAPKDPALVELLQRAHAPLVVLSRGSRKWFGRRRHIKGTQLVCPIATSTSFVGT